MRELLLVAACAVAAPGCSVAKSAMGLVTPKPTQVTVINHVPAPMIVAPVAPRQELRSRPWKAIALGAATGAGVGALVGVTSAHPVARSAAIGAGLGAVGGLVAHALAE